MPDARPFASERGTLPGSSSFLFACLLAAGGCFAALAADRPPVGVTTLTVPSPERGESIELSVWYPAGPGGHPEDYGASKIFTGTPVLRDAAPAEGIYPIVLLAHGGLRSNPATSGWIAAGLAAQGRIVVAPRPPSLGPDDARRAVDEPWLRPRDLMAGLAAVDSNPDLAPHLDGHRVAALGFELGGTSVLSLAGAELDPERFAAACDGNLTGPDCRWFETAGIDLHRIEPAPPSEPGGNPGIALAIAVDPEFSAAFDPKSLGAITIPVHVISLGTPDLSPLVKEIPGAEGTALAEASPFDAFSQCTPMAVDILTDSGEDPAICAEPGGRSRAEVQAEILAAVEAALRSGESPAP